ncbi:divergent polysaccharide deacetylase family protein [Marinobacter changyiensis]|uniref:divergent polysaccharide deacetylase family protein n=1 Tax=Marinobacter changyiensis TaxID=2604091 RepID=UPI003CCE3BBF
MHIVLRATLLMLLAPLVSAQPPASPSLALATPDFTDSETPPTIAIIIDDMGHSLSQGRRLVEMDYPVTLAFLPFRRHTTELANAAHAHQKEIMLHAPMANTRNIGLGAGGLDGSMNEPVTATTLRRAIQSIPHVRGVNNHMGSLLTQLQPNMNWVMSELFRYPLYFVDSRTIASTIAGETAAAHRVPTLTRDVFLDHEQTEEYVDAQFQLLIETAKRNGSAIGIGHPHKVTVDYLIKKLPELDEQGIAVATVSGIWAIRNSNREMFNAGEKQDIRPALARKD